MFDWFFNLFRKKQPEKVTEAYVKAQQFSAPRTPATRIPVPPKQQARSASPPPARRSDSQSSSDHRRNESFDSGLSWGLSDTGSTCEPSSRTCSGSSHSSSSDSSSSCSWD